MFNRRLSDDVAAAQEIVSAAVSRSRVPGQSPSRGNASGAFAAISTDVSGEPSGVSAQGVAFFPFLLDIDALDSDARLS